MVIRGTMTLEARAKDGSQYAQASGSDFGPAGPVVAVGNLAGACQGVVFEFAPRTAEGQLRSLC